MQNDTCDILSLSPNNIIQIVEKLRRIIDAMCYPRNGCIFSLANTIKEREKELSI